MHKEVKNRKVTEFQMKNPRHKRNKPKQRRGQLESEIIEAKPKKNDEKKLEARSVHLSETKIKASSKDKVRDCDQCKVNALMKQLIRVPKVLLKIL